MDLLFFGILHRHFWDRALHAGESVTARLYDHRGFFGRLPAHPLSNQDEDSNQTLDHLIHLSPNLVQNN